MKNRATVAGAGLLILQLAWVTGQAADAVVVSPSKGSAAVGVGAAGGKGLIGNWSGKILGKRVGSMAHVRIELAVIGMPAGSTEYYLRSIQGFTNLACRGYIKLVGAGGSKYTFEETLTEKGRSHDGGCPIAGRLELTVSAEGVAAGEWISADGKNTLIQSGELQKN